VRRNPEAGDLPVLLWLIGVRLHEIVVHHTCFVVDRIVSDDGQLGVGKSPLQVTQKVRLSTAHRLYRRAPDGSRR
jgi:hypothetical protein